jgi:hypothetical protein
MVLRLPNVAFAAASFAGAFLLFLVQPLMGKQVLPWYGGAPAIWSACLLFFQVGLVGGYAYAHLTRRLGLRRQMAWHIGLLVLSVIVAPVALPPQLKPDAPSIPELSVFVTLAIGVGLPYVLLSATAPLLQDWYARSRTGDRPYRLYVPSNVGSLGALIAYPLLVEPVWALGAQAWGWRAGLAGLAGLCAVCAWLSLRRASEAGLDAGPPARPAGGAGTESVTDVLLWVLLAAAGSALLMAMTNQLSQEVAAVPLLWVLPLALYLLTFIICFAEQYRRGLWSVLLVAALAGAGWAFAPGSGVHLAGQLAAGLGLLFAGCMVCHGELVRIRPASAHLTRFYLALAVGGAVGGAGVALVAPRVFDSYAELPLVSLLIVVLLAACLVRDRAVAAGRPLPAALVGLPVLAFVLALGATLQSAGHGPQTIAVARDFYGVVRVIQDGSDADRVQRGMLHGRILHGAQFVAPSLRRRVDNYYGPGSGIELVLRSHRSNRGGESMQIGVIGLGVGTLAGRAQAGDTIRFFELSPIVIDFAARYFTYLQDTLARVDIVPGDARLSLERELAAGAPRRGYDVFAVDAFSSDSIPVHLLTRECFQLYEAALAPGGVLAIHITNQHLDVGPVVRTLAEAAGWTVLDIRQAPNPEEAIRENRWMIVGHDAGLLAELRPYATPDQPGVALTWTDDFSALVPVVRWR